MSISELQIKARDEWYRSARLQQEYATPEYYRTLKCQRVYCPGCRADFARLARPSRPVPDLIGRPSFKSPAWV
jgi:hypothetical protein